MHPSSACCTAFVAAAILICSVSNPEVSIVFRGGIANIGSKYILAVISIALSGSLVASAATAQPAQRKIAQANAGESNSASTTRRPRIGLALGGGGSRGAAHVGVLKVLLEEHIPIDMIAGTSIGSVVGGFYAAGVPLNDIADVFLKNKFTSEFTPLPYVRIATIPLSAMARVCGYHPYDGLYYGWKFRNYANKMIGPKKIEQFKIPYAAVVTDVVTGKSCRVTTGDPGLAMQASTAVPGLKKPAQIGNRLFCDGGVINNVPVNHVREMGADLVIAVDIDETLKDVPINKFRALGSMERQALRIQLAAFDEPSSKKADIYIHPDTTGINLVSFKKSDGQTGIEAGIKAARAAIPEIKRRLSALGIAVTPPDKPL
jgi:NTE family protein